MVKTWRIHISRFYLYHEISNKFLYDMLYWSIPKSEVLKMEPPKKIPPLFTPLRPPVIPQFRGIPRVDPAITGLPGSYRMKGGPFCSWKMAKFPEWCMHFPLQVITHWSMMNQCDHPKDLVRITQLHHAEAESFEGSFTTSLSPQSLNQS